MEGKHFAFVSLEDDVEYYIINNRPKGWSRDWKYLLDWKKVVYNVQRKPVYKLSQSPVSGCMTALSVQFCNNTSTKQTIRLSEKVVTTSDYSFDIHGGVVSRALSLELDEDLRSHGLPNQLPVKREKTTGSCQVTHNIACNVQAPAKKTMSVKVTGKELRMRGTFEQKVRISGEILVRYYNKDGVFQMLDEIPVHDLFVPTTEATGIYFQAGGGMSTTIRGTCSFRLAVDNEVVVSEK